jgi:hypothetical protein
MKLETNYNFLPNQNMEVILLGWQHDEFKQHFKPQNSLRLIYDVKGVLVHVAL